MQAVQTITAMGPLTKIRRPPSSIWLALAIALLVHIILLLVAANWRFKQPLSQSSRIEIRVEYEDIPPFVEPRSEAVAAPHGVIKPVPQSIEQTSQEMPPAKPAEQPSMAPLPMPAQTSAQSTPANDQPGNLKTTQQQQSRTILSSQFITEPSVTDKIFGPGMPATKHSETRGFHFPPQPNMVAMLDKPIPDLPFQFTEGLVHFAYEPGAKGDLQRFWDKITPEFGWRTNYGTEVKCAWVLVIAACGWGRSKD